MTSVLICIPTVPGRQAMLVTCIRSYEQRTNPSIKTKPLEMNFSVVHDARSAGEGWQRCVEQGLAWWPQTTHVHFSNDDVCVADWWLDPLVEACDEGTLPAMRIEPAGGHCQEEIFQTHPPLPLRERDVPRNEVAYFFAGLPEEQPTVDKTEVDHGNLPFCSVEQWRQIGPFPPIHYGTDRWFAERGRARGWPTVARLSSVAYNYNVNIGRHRGDWEEQDFAAFDGVFALPAYLEGVLEPSEPHPLRETTEGLRWVRDWRKAHETGVFHGPDVQRDLMTDAGRFKLLRDLPEYKARRS